MKVDGVLSIARSMLVDLILCLLEAFSRLCGRGWRYFRGIYALAMLRDGQTSQEISLSKEFAFMNDP